MNHWFQSLFRGAGVAILALVAALFVLYGILSLLQMITWWPNEKSAEEQKKVEILAALKSDSVPSISEREQVLNELSAPSQEAEMSEEEKLEILKKLRSQ